MFADVGQSFRTAPDQPCRLGLAEAIEDQSQERARRNAEDLLQIVSPHEWSSLACQKFPLVEAELLLKEELMSAELLGLLANCGPQIGPGVEEHDGGSIPQLPEEAVSGPGGYRRLARQVERAQMMPLDPRDEGARLPTEAKAFAKAREDRQSSLLVTEKPDSTIRLHAPGLRFAQVVQEPEQLEDRPLGDAGFDLPFEPLFQPARILGKELPKVSQQQFDRPKRLH